MNTPSTDSFVSIVGSYTVDIQDAENFAEIARESVAQTVNKNGCLYYTASQDLTHSNVFRMVEGWASQAALDAHLNSPDFKKTLEEALKLRILNREIYVSESNGRTLMS